VITAGAFAGRHYAVYGLARSGLAAVEALLASGARVTAWDDRLLPGEGRDPEQREPLDPGLPRGTEIANLNKTGLSQFDSLVVTPGLPLNRHPIAQRARDAGVEIIGDIELFARARPELPPHKVVGITGTNGKSTTTALVHHILKTAGAPTTMGGNIGLPILAEDPLPEGGVYVLELSSYQIDLTQSLDCDVAVLLNITPDHLDRYESFEAYAASKARLFQMQSAKNGMAVIVGEDEFSRRLYNNLRASNPAGTWHQLGSGIGGDIWDLWRGMEPDEVEHEHRHWGSLQGPHNAQNAVAAMLVAGALGVSIEDTERGLRTYPGLAHRMERIRERDGVTFVNDSKATNPTATAPALAAFGHVRWICGGQAKSDNLDECAPHFGHVRTAYTIGEAAELFERLLKPHMPVKNCGKLDAAVREAAADAQAGDTVLLSPACASFDQFRDFEDRGDTFRTLVGAL
jgi:UDP-N-acetylmuramoylalanine--D-glutamate ligase